EPEPTVRNSEEVAREHDAAGLQRTEMEVAATAVTGRQEVREEASLRSGQRLDGGVEKARLERPPGEVAVADPARQPERAAARHDGVPSRLVELLGDLAARLAAADDE